MISKITSVSVSPQDYIVFNLKEGTPRGKYESLLNCIDKLFPENKERTIVILGDGDISVIGDENLKAIGLMRIPK